MVRTLCALLSLTLLVGQKSPATATIDRELGVAIQRGDIPGGIVAAATTGDRMLYEGAFGKADVAHGIAMTTDAIFRIASMTKPVTSVAAMQLFEQGRFALDDPAEKYLSELARIPVVDTFDVKTGAYTLHPAPRSITIRQLLTHTSGLAYGFTSAVDRDFKPRDGDRFPAGPAIFDPGTQWWYGTSIDWVGRLVERLSGQTLESYFRDHIFGPLRMADTSYNVPEAKQGRLVTRHRRAEGKPDGAVTELPNQPLQPATTFNGGGGLNSTAGDYIRFVRMVLNRGALDGARILKPETIAMMERNQIGDIGVRALKTADPSMSMDFSFVNDGKDKWGLGFLITSVKVPGKRSAGSLSWGGINNTYFWIDPASNVGGVILMQFLPFADTQALAAYDAFERGVYRALADRASQ